MGGCASRPKDLDTKQQPLIAEEATTPKKAEGETVPQEDNGGETEKEEPLVDVSEPGQEVAKTEDPAAEAKPEEAKPTGEAAGEAEEEETEEVKEKPEEEPATPTVEDKSDAPLVTL
ncbi:A-kinase anchor protein like [Actinidia chinensis var. chinensis]|uniref:A-kinase anchor protein like n=1 Tax=Actinidia chinensis var. chinensis TaxID=1590841 RepID=A0A2R6RS91_ACTCC|nr:A-kinase anchor protein like [Actinidia chinensis var. chinensis]PSS32941.1 A-kinase anchor protein like [Actinidia chinensis var. chinensis]